MGTAQATRVLNPTLYAALCERFGEVHIGNVGQERVVQETKSHLGTRKFAVAHGESYDICCPFCHDRRFRLRISYLYGVRHNEFGNQLWLVKCFNQDCLNDKVRRHLLAEMIQAYRNRNQRGAVERIDAGVQVREITETTLPGEVISFHNLPPSHHAYRYLVESRRFDPLYLSTYYGVGFCTQAVPQYPAARNRIMAPVWFKQKLVGWQGRWPEDLDWKQAATAKYYTKPGMPKSLLFYNFDVAIQWPFVVVVEGLPSVWRIGGPAVAAFGHEISPMHIELLAENWPGKPVIVILDHDVPRLKIDFFVSQMQQRGLAAVPQYAANKNDPADYTHEAIVGMIRATALTAGIQLPAW